MVILDDLHWADRPTLLLVRHLAGLRLTRVLLVGAYRDPGQPDGPLIETLGALARQQTVIRIDPPRLSPADAVALLAAAAGGDPDEAGQPGWPSSFTTKRRAIPSIWWRCSNMPRKPA